MQLNQTFLYRGWEIKYTLLNSSPSPPTPTTPIVFVHGTPWSSATFFALAQALSTQLPTSPILLYDLPGYGSSQTYTPQPTDKPQSLFSGNTSIKFQASALAALLHHLDFPSAPPHIIAHDIAGTIVLRAHLLLHCKLTSLLLMDTNTVLPWGDGFYQLVREKPEVFVELPGNVFEEVVRAVVRSASFTPEGVLGRGSKWEEVLVEPWLGSGRSGEDGDETAARQRSFVRQIAQADDADVAEMLDASLYDKVACPVKILWGQEDTWIPRAKMERLRELLGGKTVKEFVVVPGAGHLVMADKPERVAMEVLGWVRGAWEV